MRVRRRTHAFDDPTARYAGRDALDNALRRLPPDLVEILAAYVYGVSVASLQRRLGEQKYPVMDLLGFAVQEIRSSPGGEALVEELLTGHGPSHSRVLREAGQRIGVAAAPQCQRCATPFSQAAVGRPRRYCGNACRQAAYRQRDRARANDGAQPLKFSPLPAGLRPKLDELRWYSGNFSSEQRRKQLLDRWAGRTTAAVYRRWVVYRPTSDGRSLAGLVDAILASTVEQPSGSVRPTQSAWQVRQAWLAGQQQPAELARLAASERLAGSALMTAPVLPLSQPTPIWSARNRPPKSLGQRSATQGFRAPGRSYSHRRKQRSRVQDLAT
ncbi:hypothetical protein [Lentzea sp. NPDC051838]|uniref:hypothetical protein n=1 Tax=Lentzea sp. NPDC051838 TaxID=3154849 RepID=UPI00341FE396